MGSHDLSDCDLYTTCEPCPMCWGACQWSRLNKVYIGVGRLTAAKYGFDDKVFYDEVEHRYGYMADSHAVDKDGTVSEDRVHKNMMEVHTGVLKGEIEKLFTGAMNKTYHRRFESGQGMLRKAYEEAFVERPESAGEDGKKKKPPSFPEISVTDTNIAAHEQFMKRAVEVARINSRAGNSKEREPFAAVVVKDGQVIATGANSVLRDRDATATAEVNAIRAAARCLGTYDLKECTVYSTALPDVMSMAACLWARVPKVICGVTQEFAMMHGHEDGWLHFHELMTLETDKRTIPTTSEVAEPVCEEVFQFWSGLNGKIY